MFLAFSGLFRLFLYAVPRPESRFKNSLFFTFVKSKKFLKICSASADDSDLGIDARVPRCT